MLKTEELAEGTNCIVISYRFSNSLRLVASPPGVSDNMLQPSYLNFHGYTNNTFIVRHWQNDYIDV